MKFFYGEENYKIKQLINEEISNFNGEVINFNDIYSFEKIEQEIMTLSFFNQQKLIVIKNHQLFFDEILNQKMLEIIKKKFTDIKFIFVLEVENLPKNALIDYLLKYGQIKFVEKLNETNIISTIFQVAKDLGANISYSAAIKLSIKLPYDLSMIHNELQKLTLYSIYIDETAIEDLITDYTKEHYFSLSNAILVNDYRGIIKTYQERKEFDDENLIINQISLILETAIIVASYKSLGFNNRAISSKTKFHIFRIKKACELIETIGLTKIKKLLQDLAILDETIKRGKLEKNLGLEQFILKLLQ